MSEKQPCKIVVTANGPYLVSGDLPLAIQIIEANQQGESEEWKQGREFETSGTFALCRCGHSGKAPFCDGTHAKVDFDGAETATRLPYDAQKTVQDGPTMVLEDARPLCAVGRFCDVAGSAWALVTKSGDPAAREQLIREVVRCPSGRLVVRDKTSGEAIEPVFEPSIGVVEDPTEKCSGPLWVRGGIALESQDGQAYIARNRMTLCRCGASKNKPFCDGSHVDVHYQDGIQHTAEAEA